MKTIVTLLNLTLALTCVSALAADPKAPATSTETVSTRADNTAINQRDKSGATQTPQDQSNQEQDRKLLASVRRAIVAEKSISTKGRNAKVMVEGGVVTLRGPVKSAEEKALVESITKQVDGVKKIDNQLDVKTKS